MSRIRSLSSIACASALALFGLSTPSLAEPTLRYNYDYVCDRGLRIVVGHCRHDSDMPGVAPTAPEDDYCQVYYPDRPKTGGIEAMETVLRSHLIESLQACGALGATPPGSSARPNPATAAPSRPPAPAPATTAAPAGSRPATLSGQAFCDAIRHAGSLAAEGFRSIDLGPGHALTDTINVHDTSLGLPGAGAERCDVTHETGKPNEYSCSWPESESAEQQLSELARTLKTCVGGQYEFHETKGDIPPYAIARNGGVEYEAAYIFNFVTDVDFVSLSIRPIKDAPRGAAASAATPAAAPAAAPGIGKAHWRNLDFGDDEAYFVLPANLKPGGPTGRGWFLVLHRDLSHSLDGRIDHIAIAQQLWSADCAHNTLSWLQDSYFSADGAPIGAYVKPTPQHVYINPSLTTMWTGMLSLLCARPIDLDEADYFSDAVILRKNWLLPTSSKASAPAQASAAPPPSGPASAAPSGRPRPAAMPIGPAMCPLLRRLETLAHEDFRSIELGPDRAMGKDADKVHRTSMPIPGASFCQIEHYPDEPLSYTCIWPQATEKEVDDQFVNMGRALEQCTGGTLDLSMLEFGDVTVKVRGVEFVTSIISDFMSLSVHMAQP